MKVSELKQKLEHAKDDDNVMVAIKLPYVTVGAIPMTPVKYAFTGFDWENGNFVLTPDENLSPANRDFEAQMKEMQRVTGLVQYENRGLKAEIKRLKKRQWVGLTDEDYEELLKTRDWGVYLIEAVETKLKEKNT